MPPLQLTSPLATAIQKAREGSKNKEPIMSSHSSRASKLTEDEINHLISKLQPLLPQLNQRRNGTVPASKILKETCNYIRSLHGEIDDLSERLSQLLNSMDTNGVNIDEA